MADRLLKAFATDPTVTFDLHREFPLLRKFGADALQSDGSPNWDFLREAYGEGVYIRRGTSLEWQEEILAIEGLEESLHHPQPDGFHFQGYATDSFTVQAQRRGKTDDYGLIETVIYGFTRSEGKILLGARGGSEGRIGTVLAVPGGAVGFYNVENPVKRAVYQEAAEEAAIQPWETVSLRTIGIFRHDEHDGSLGNFFVHAADLTISLTEITEMHARALSMYNDAKGIAKGSEADKELFARAFLKGAATENRKIAYDCWENSRLITVEDQPDALVRLIDDVEQNGKGLLPSMYGALALYFRHAFGEEEYGKLLDRPSFKEQVVEGFI